MEVFTIITTLINTAIAVFSSIISYVKSRKNTDKKIEEWDEKVRKAQIRTFERVQFDHTMQYSLNCLNEYIKEIDSSHSIPVSKVFNYQSLANRFIKVKTVFQSEDLQDIKKIHSQFKNWTMNDFEGNLTGKDFALCKSYLLELKNILEMKAGNPNDL